MDHPVRRKMPYFADHAEIVTGDRLRIRQAVKFDSLRFKGSYLGARLVVWGCFNLELLPKVTV